MFTIGCDPELFLEENGRFISIEDKNGPLISGTKSNPFEVKGGAIQVDGVAGEFNINPAKDFNTFYNNVKSVICTLKNNIREKKQNVLLRAVPTATFEKQYFEDLPTHTKLLGCEPDFDAYKNGEKNPRPQTDEPFRTASGHIHIGWTKGVNPQDEGHLKDCIMVVQELDKYLLFASQDWDKDEKRRKLYGKPGSFRPKSYGVEYRPLSNAWLNSPNTIRSVYFITMGVMRSLDSGDHKFYVNNFGKNNQEKSLYSLKKYIPELF